MLVSTLLVPIMLAVGAVAGADINRIVMFGDSSSDSGRSFNLTQGNGPTIPSNAFFQGRWSNGNTWIEVLAKERKVQLDNYACGGATTSDKLLQGSLGGKFNQPLRSNGLPINVPGLDTQVNEYIAKKETGDKSKVLFALWGGANDKLTDEFLGLNKSGSFYAKAQYEQWELLAKNGAKNIMVVVPPPQSAFDISYGFEITLLAAKFQLKNLGVKFGLFQSSLTFIKLLIAPGLFGFKFGTSERCCVDCYSGLPPTGFAKVCSNPDEYIIWDGTHPTAATHKIIAKDAGDFIDFWWGFNDDN
ncbi:hypothetical protein BC829DRAFT_447540 [Chytridium lagenaria]|nr:hypothetical protein BC829DRAFT_447540 [Chytridium lagenaria]